MNSVCCLCRGTITRGVFQLLAEVPVHLLNNLICVDVMMKTADRLRWKTNTVRISIIIISSISSKDTVHQWITACRSGRARTLTWPAYYVTCAKLTSTWTVGDTSHVTTECMQHGNCKLWLTLQAYRLAAKKPFPFNFTWFSCLFPTIPNRPTVFIIGAYLVFFTAQRTPARRTHSKIDSKQTFLSPLYPSLFIFRPRSAFYGFISVVNLLLSSRSGIKSSDPYS